MKVQTLKDEWSGWTIIRGELFNERLGLRFTEEHLKLYWIDRQRLREYERWRTRIIQYKFDFIEK